MSSASPTIRRSSSLELACLLPGEFNRRGQAKRVILAVAAAFLFETIDLGVNDLAARYSTAIPLMYVVDLLPFALGLALLMPGRLRFGWRWATLAGARVR